MPILKNMLKMISYQEDLKHGDFILKETQDDRKKSGPKSKKGTDSENTGEEIKAFADQQDSTENKSNEELSGKNSPDSTGVDKQSPSRPKVRKPLRPSDIRQVKARGWENSPVTVKNFGSVSASLEINREALEKLYGLPENRDIVIRNFIIDSTPPVEGFAVFIDGLTDKSVQNMLFQGLMLFANGIPLSDAGKLANSVKKRLLSGNQVSIHSTFREVLDAVNFGDTAIFLEGCANAITVETKGWEHRNVDRPVTEQVVRGPQEGFGEYLRANTALIRKLLRNENLTTEFMKAGTRNQADIAIMYLRNLANPDLIAEVKRRIKSIKTDYLNDSGVLEQFIEDHPYNLFPQVVATERPDRASSMIAEGRVAIFVDGNPFVLVVPTTLYSLLHTGEENYLRWQYGTFLRYIRTLAFYLSFLLPGLYLSVVLFHHEMFPPELLLTIAGNRERVPFPSVVEVLLLEISFELVREASLRLPGMMGSTIGIVGALILGQAAVEANIVSPILVILVSVTGLSSFAIPNYSLSFALRIYRFFYIALGATLGFFGITLGIAAHIFLTANIKSFGVPYVAPAGPRTVPGADVVTRLPVFFHNKRPDYINPQDITRQRKVSRGWVKEKGGDSSD